MTPPALAVCSPDKLFQEQLNAFFNRSTVVITEVVAHELITVRGTASRAATLCPAKCQRQTIFRLLPCQFGAMIRNTTNDTHPSRRCAAGHCRSLAPLPGPDLRSVKTRNPMRHPLFKIFDLTIKLRLGHDERTTTGDWDGNFNTNLPFDFSSHNFFPMLSQ
jgi:hypothetical protein